MTANRWKRLSKTTQTAHVKLKRVQAKSNDGAHPDIKLPNTLSPLCNSQPCELTKDWQAISEQSSQSGLQTSKNKQREGERWRDSVPVGPTWPWDMLPPPMTNKLNHTQHTSYILLLNKHFHSFFPAPIFLSPSLSPAFSPSARAGGRHRGSFNCLAFPWIQLHYISRCSPRCILVTCCNVLSLFTCSVGGEGSEREREQHHSAQWEGEGQREHKMSIVRGWKKHERIRSFVHVLGEAMMTKSSGCG